MSNDELVNAKCHGCGTIKKIKKTDTEFCCLTCGAVNGIPKGEFSNGAVLDCIPPTGFEWTLPTGVLKDPSGKVVGYITAIGSKLSKVDYRRIYGCDPEIMLANMRKLGIDGIEGYKNLSTLGRKGGYK